MTMPCAHVELQPRDIVLLRDLFVSRIMTLSHLAALHFDGRAEAAKKRAQKLKSAGYISERPRKSRDPGILTLTLKGFRELVQNGHVADLPRLSLTAFERRARVSDLTIRHELAVMDVKTALVRGISSESGMTVLEFTTWPLLNQFGVSRQRRSAITVKPDGYLRVEETTKAGEVYEHAFYFEVDRGTETLGTLSERAVCYRDHYARGGYAMSRGGNSADYAAFPFRVLYVLPSPVRLANTARALLALQPPIETQVWLTTMKELCTDALGHVWVRPRDLRTGSEQKRSLFGD